jgi:hypothetical protein
MALQLDSSPRGLMGPEIPPPPPPDLRGAPGPGRGPNAPSTGHTACEGNAQLWTSPGLWGFTYVSALTPGGPGGYWELPYLLPFDRKGNAIDNLHIEPRERSTCWRLGTAIATG